MQENLYYIFDITILNMKNQSSPFSFLINQHYNKNEISKMIIKYQLTIITNFLLLLGLLMCFYINSFDKALALLVSPTSSSLSTLSLLQSDLAAINSGNPPSISQFNLSPGYRIEPVMWNLTLPSSVTFDDKNNMYISEAGFVYGGLV